MENTEKKNQIIINIDIFFKYLIFIYVIYFIVFYKKHNIKLSNFLISIIGLLFLRSFFIYILTDYKPKPLNNLNQNIIHEIVLKDFVFYKKNDEKVQQKNFKINIKRNDIVRFINEDDVRHSITFFDNRINNTPILKQGDSFMIRFKDKGQYQFKTIYTEVNSLGTIIVE